MTGLATLDGEPLAHADVTFWAKDNPALGAYGTRTDADGRFVLFKDPRPGAYIKPGRYVALVAQRSKDAPKEIEPAAVAASSNAGAPNLLPAVYSHKDDSPFIVDVKAGDNDFTLELKTRP